MNFNVLTSHIFQPAFGYTCDDSALPANDAQVQKVLKGWQSAIKAVHGTSFTPGPICQTIYQATGSSSDWMYGQMKIPYSLAVELRDTGRYGFVLPANQIIPSGEEAWAGLQYLVKNIPEVERSWEIGV